MNHIERDARRRTLAPLPAIATALISLILVTAPTPSISTIHTGFGYAEFDSAWDFSDSTTCELFTGYCGDFSIGITRASATTSSQNLFLLAMPPSAGIAVAPFDSTYEELTTAPFGRGVYDVLVAIYIGVTYVIRTNEGNYAKIRPIELRTGTEFWFEYSYQDDGSRVLVGSVSTEETTWGRIKALYRGAD